jgi:hypothetical protein
MAPWQSSTLKLARALRDQGGFTQDAADATAEDLNDALGADVATRTDIDTTRAGLKADIDAFRAELNAELNATKMELKGDIRLLQWQIAIMYALQIAILVKLFIH